MIQMDNMQYMIVAKMESDVQKLNSHNKMVSGLYTLLYIL